MGGWWRRQRDARLLRRRAIPLSLWQTTLSLYPFIAARDDAQLQRLQALAALFLARKEFTAVGGLELSDEIAVAIAAQACLPVLELGLDAYDSFVGIVVHPDEVVARREVTDEHGIVHHFDEVLTGEAMEGGPVMLSWNDVAHAGSSAARGYNVVIHEFVHVLDMHDGIVDGMPPLPDAQARRHWRLVMQAAFERLRRSLDAGQGGFLDPYGAESIEEFFPVAAEAFFVAPQALRAEQPALYELFAGYFRQDPATLFERP
ncbi:MAG: zinc-dependent peptidase [Methylibium sp.]|uniref:M90 family metallopeptidase n=1 Tax=Methylibium sp. TaxID=2067992 RepID=UPI001830F10D|nr:M90 family metallopeptidase [Methylibium sp.]MBA3598806.1 zinc-dependent peptidase [Methylibium sp.]